MKMKRKTDRDGTKLQDLRAKALRRGDKLANTLRKLVARSDPNDASVEPLVKALEQVLPRLRRLAGQQDGLPAHRHGRQAERASKAGHELATPSKARNRKARRPASAPAIAESRRGLATAGLRQMSHCRSLRIPPRVRALASE